MAKDKSIIKREVQVRPIPKLDSYVARNENIPDNEGNMHSFNPSRVFRITPKVNKHGTPVRAFTNVKEEENYLPKLINIAPTDQRWFEEKERFWRSILITFQGTSLKLDTSFRLYLNKAAKLPNIEEEVPITALNFKKYCKDNPELEMYFGEPVKLDDYWKWRYCLNTSQVANTRTLAEEKRGRSMQFYLYTKEEHLRLEQASNEVKFKARSLMVKYANENDIVEGVLRNYERNRGFYSNETLKRYFIFEELSIVERQGIYMDIADKFPTSFIKLVNDDNLKFRTFLFRAVSQGILVITDGTTIVKYGEEVIGNSIESAIISLKKNAKLHEEISRKMTKIRIDMEKEIIDDIEKVKAEREPTTSQMEKKVAQKEISK